MTALSLALALLAMPPLTTLPACGVSPRAVLSTSARLVSDRAPVDLRPTLTTRSFVARSNNEVTLILTDIDPARLAPDQRLGDLTGHIILIDMFLRPRPGKTPIEPTATTATVTFLLLTDGEVGAYRGSGFFLPSTLSDERLFAGRLRDATLRPVGATPGFSDLLGPSTLALSCVATRNETAVEHVRQAVVDLTRRAIEVQ